MKKKRFSKFLKHKHTVFTTRKLKVIQERLKKMINTKSVKVEIILTRIPMGFKFVPTASELVTHYLLKKIQQENGEDSIFICHRINEVDVYKYTPLQLQATYKVAGEKAMHFFCRRTTSQPSSVPGNRGFWEKTGRRDLLYDGLGCGWTGLKESFRFFQRLEGQSRAESTKWFMEEFSISFIAESSGMSAPGDHCTSNETQKWVISKIYEIGNHLDEDPLEHMEFLNSGFNVFEHPVVVPPLTSVEEYLASLPAGFQFCPSDKDLIVHYLRRKIFGQHLPCDHIPEDDVYKYQPKQLIDYYKPKTGDDTWYFFTTGYMQKQPLGGGHWKRGGVRTIVNFYEESGGEVVVVSGLRTTLKFFQNATDNTNWIMHQFSIVHPMDGNKYNRWVLCKISKSRQVLKDHDAGGRSSQGHSAFRRFPDYYYSQH